jgi:signal transduction histidine kinase
VIAMILQSARAIGALAHVQSMRVHHEQAIATIGHEIRQPLSALVTALELVQRKADGVPPAPVRAAHRQAMQLVRLVDALLDAARVLGGQLRLSRHLIDLRAVLSFAADSVRVDVAARNQRLEWELPSRPVWCIGDPDRLQEVALNLLTNAHRYTPEGGRITITVGQAGESTVLFAVRDTGVGVDAETRERIFRPFERPTASREGLGLGLAISLGIVRGHGGTLTVSDNAPDPGSTFRVELPGVLGRTREICAAVQRTRDETHTVIARARALRNKINHTGVAIPSDSTG